MVSTERWGWLVAMALLPGCGSEPGPSTGAEADWRSGSAKSSRNRPPAIGSVGLEPAEPAAGERVQAVVRVMDPDGDDVQLRFEWSLAGEPLEASSDSLRVEGARPGQRLEVKVVASDGRREGEARVAATQIRNRLPVVDRTELDPASQVAVGTPVRVRAFGSDPDGDEVGFLYRWELNGDPAGGDGESLDTAGLRRGDEIRVYVTPTDGRGQGHEGLGGVLRVANGVPEIVSEPRGLEADGIFRYRVEARDPDGDPNLRYSLVEGPDGMTVGLQNGEVRWKARPDQAGAQRVAVAVEDTAGARVVQEFELWVQAEGASLPAAAGR